MSNSHTQREQWIGIRQAAHILATTPYRVQRAALAGHIRSVCDPVAGIFFSIDDCESLARSCDGAVPSLAGPRQLQPA